MKDNESKKQVPLRLSLSLYAELSRWADEDFRSLNGQIEYLLTLCVKKRRGGTPDGKKEESAKGNPTDS